MINELKAFIGKKVERLFLIVWPPLGEASFAKIDISGGFIFKDSPNELIKISTDTNDLTTPSVENMPIPKNFFEWENFNQRMKKWMDSAEGMEMVTEYYEVSRVELFKNIVNQSVVDVELIKMANESPIGIKLIFRNDFVLSSPLSDGNTIETNSFNKNENLKIFSALGKMEFISLKTLV
jgi:hypothetical protein